MIDQQKHLADADYCWRMHHCTLFLASAAQDALNENAYDKDLQQCSFSELANKHIVAKEVLKLCTKLGEDNLIYHPRVHRRQDIVNLAYSLYSNERAGSLLRLHLNDYFEFETDKDRLWRLLKNAYVNSSSTRLMIRMIESKESLAASWSYDGVIGLSRPQQWHQQLFYTSSIEMAIGHFGTMLDFLAFLEYADSIGMFSEHKPRVALIRTGRGQGKRLFEHTLLGSQYVAEVDYNSILDIPTLELVSALNWNPSLQWVSKAYRHDFESWLSARVDNQDASTTNKKVFFHLRSSGFKGDEAIPAMSLRNVDANNYRSLSRLIQAQGYQVLRITADHLSTANLDMPILEVNSQVAETAQWSFIANSSFLVGTQSGISHFSAMTNFSCLLTNYVSLPFERSLSKFHLVCTKNIYPQSANTLCKDRLIELLIEPWVLSSESLMKYVTITENTEQQLAKAFEEFTLICNGEDGTHCTFHKILDECKMTHLKDRYPNWNIFSESAGQIRFLIQATMRLVLQDERG